ncbi:MAG: bifunctional phosphoribosylaminoimidazolecarboxamide formyltransferase/IMP cyclohydrolase [Erysipelotrichaceae bacterium]|nr:bifunctional phosphoribosylaminoimidazolecarboxamide formyltransferase/IMP cyclohydrolase [Erysipelotrichaceae bacterium]
MKRALVSVSDKTNLIPFVQGLVKHGYQIISTGGTKKALDAAGVSTVAIDDVTGFPEILDGRVKTLHPLVHGGLLSVRDSEKHMQQCKDLSIEMIDLVCVNLYPFKQTISKEGFTHAEAIENIDIGGPSMLRSAAKNHKYVTVVTDVADYNQVLAEIAEFGDTTLKTREKLAAKVYRTTANYDAMIAEYMTNYVEEDFTEHVTLTFDKKQALRYGENPHQNACFYVDMHETPYSIAHAEQLHGKELSYNNIQDANATLQMLKEFKDTPCCVAVKHMNPCGIGTADTLYQAWRKAYEADMVSIFGGIVAFNEEVNEAIAIELHSMFLEIILAPSYTKEALEILTKKKNLRVMTFKKEAKTNYTRQFVSVSGGLLMQDVDTAEVTADMLKVVTQKAPTEQEIQDMLFGNKVVKHVKSNAIVIVKDGQTLGIGAGQMNRVGAAKIALEQAGEKAKGAVMASDAFFPMDDTVTLAAEYGITAVIQPGGSIRDEDSVVACDKNGMAMVYTGKRHFKH